MKLFWAFIAVLVLAAASMLAMRNSRHTGTPDVAIAAAPTTPKTPPVAPLLTPTTPPAPTDSIASNASTPAPPSSPAPADQQASASPSSDPLASLNSMLGLPNGPAPTATPTTTTTTTTPITPTTAPTAPADQSASETTSPAESVDPAVASALFRNQFEVVPARKKPGEEGYLILDERFPLKGAGTEQDPYEISWDYLVSASETFQPRLGKKRLPERITMLDGKSVRITGYVAFPIMAAAQNEMLSMRNMWDGCCIGVPPTPYDAIEVKLAAAATGRDRFTSFGTVEGVIQVDPYIKGNWLLGLYLLENAKLSQLKEGNDPGKHGGM